MTELPKPPRGHAFSLIELSVVLVIAALIFGGGTVMITAAIKSRALDTSQQRIYKAMKDLLDFSTAYGYLPCPADLSEVYGDPSYGVGTGSGVAGANNCTAANYTHVNADGVRSVMGLFPVQTLSQTNEDSLDGTGNRILYAVTEPMTQSNALATYPGQVPESGSLIVYDDLGNQRPGLATYVLVSMGPNQRGARSQESGAIVGVGTPSAAEQMNAKVDAGYAAAAFTPEFTQSKLLESDDIVAAIYRRDLSLFSVPAGGATSASSTSGAGSSGI